MPSTPAFVMTPDKTALAGAGATGWLSAAIRALEHTCFRAEAHNHQKYRKQHDARRISLIDNASR